jgi:DTW domain-containing protein YfiP
MDVQTYLENRKLRELTAPRKRLLCVSCFQPGFSCFCRHIVPFDPGIKFVILIDHIEFKRRIATGRLSHLCLQNSELIRGFDYSENVRVNGCLADTKYQSVILYPGLKSLNLSSLTSADRASLSPAGKPLQIFVIDGTWNTARKMLRLSTNLQHLPRICFTPKQPSRFRVRKQPKEFCYSTVEAIHHTIDLLERPQGPHDNLLLVFDKMVEQQLAFIEHSHKIRPRSRHSSRSTR